ncbi:MAG: alpha/beta hydrolase [Solirubrobacterales bacterium]|nr:alpha/beta hydrolase [Solirubrobacterales bacterium]
MTVVDIDTQYGPARAHLRPADEAVGSLILGHGAGGGVAARDLVAATEAALSERFTVALVEQPYRVAGRRSPAPAGQLDAAWVAVVEHLAGVGLVGQPLIAGGRSAGARVACRTVTETGASALLCLAFPLHPPGRPEKSRQAELDAVRVPVLVVQGGRDPFGVPPPGRSRRVVTVAANHSLSTDLGAVKAAVRNWLAERAAPDAAATRTAAPRAR